MATAKARALTMSKAPAVVIRAEARASNLWAAAMVGDSEFMMILRVRERAGDGNWKLEAAKAGEFILRFVLTCKCLLLQMFP